MKSHRQKILITGGTGYIGARVAQYLATEGNLDIVLGSRTVQASPVWLSEASILKMDYQDQKSLLDVTKEVDVIFHLAAMNEIDSAKNPAGAMLSNGVDTIRLLEAAQANKVSRFVYLSTAHVYGAPLSGRIDESKLPRPSHPYASSHRAAEDFVLAAHDAGKIIGIVLRLSNGFGSPAHPDVNRWTLLVNDLCRQAVTQGKLILRSAGLQRRDFISLKDIGRVFGHMLDISREQVGDGLFNVGGGWSPRVIDIAHLIQERCLVILGFMPPIICLQEPKNEETLDLDFRVDKLLASGFELSSNVLDEIDATILFCQNNFLVAQ